MYPILVSMAEPADLLQCLNLCKTLPLLGPGGDQLLTPSLQFFLLLKQYIFILIYPLYIECVYVMSCENM